MSTKSAVVEAEPAMTPIADVYNLALKGAQVAEAAPAAEPTKEAEPVAAAPIEAAPVTEKPASALEAALAEPVQQEAPKDALEEFPEVLPNEGRKDHWKKARERMATDHATIKERDSAIAELNSKLGQAKENPEATARIKELESKVAELTDGITAANIELLPEFRVKYVDGELALLNKAAEKVKAYGGNPDALKEALAMKEGLRRDAAIEEAMGTDVNDIARAKVNAIVTQIDDLREEAANMRGPGSQQAYERLTARQKEQQQAQAQEAERRKVQTFEKVAQSLQKEPMFRLLPVDVPGADKWNESVSTVPSKAKALFGPDVTPEQTVVAAYKASRFDDVVEMLRTTQAEVAQLRKQQSELDGASPDLRGGKPPVKDAYEANLEKSPGQLWHEAMANAKNQED